MMMMMAPAAAFSLSLSLFSRVAGLMMLPVDSSSGIQQSACRQEHWETSQELSCILTVHDARFKSVLLRKHISCLCAQYVYMLCHLVLLTRSKPSYMALLLRFLQQAKYSFCSYTIKMI